MRRAGSNPSFFPIGVFLGKPTHAEQLAALGINVFMGAEHHPPMSDATDHLFVMAQSPVSLHEWTQAEIGDNPNVVGWFIADESEMGYSGCNVWPTNAEKLIHWNEWCEDTRAYNNGRFLFANFGNGVLNSFWAPGTMDQWMAPINGCACNKYAYTSFSVQFVINQSLYWPGTIEEAKSASSYGWFMDQNARFQCGAIRSGGQSGVFTDQMPFLAEPGREIIHYEELKGAVWASITHEARGISYFQHNGFYETFYPGGPGPPTVNPEHRTGPDHGIIFAGQRPAGTQGGGPGHQRPGQGHGSGAQQPVLSMGFPRQRHRYDAQGQR